MIPIQWLQRAALASTLFTAFGSALAPAALGFDREGNGIQATPPAPGSQASDQPTAGRPEATLAPTGEGNGIRLRGPEEPHQ